MLRQYFCWEERVYNPDAPEEVRYHLNQINADGEKLLEEKIINPAKESTICGNFQDIASFLKKQRPKDKEGRFGKVVLYSARIGDDVYQAPHLHLGENNLVAVSGRLHEIRELKEIGKCLANMLENPVFPS